MREVLGEFVEFVVHDFPFVFVVGFLDLFVASNSSPRVARGAGVLMIESYSIKRRKSEIEQKLNEVESAIRVFERPKVYLIL